MTVGDTETEAQDVTVVEGVPDSLWLALFVKEAVPQADTEGVEEEVGQEEGDTVPLEQVLGVGEAERVVVRLEVGQVEEDRVGVEEEEREGVTVTVKEEVVQDDTDTVGVVEGDPVPQAVGEREAVGLVLPLGLTVTDPLPHGVEDKEGVTEVVWDTVAVPLAEEHTVAEGVELGHTLAVKLPLLLGQVVGVVEGDRDGVVVEEAHRVAVMVPLGVTEKVWVEEEDRLFVGQGEAERLDVVDSVPDPHTVGLGEVEGLRVVEVVEDREALGHWDALPEAQKVADTVLEGVGEELTLIVMLLVGQVEGETEVVAVRVGVNEPLPDPLVVIVGEPLPQNVAETEGVVDVDKLAVVVIEEVPQVVPLPE